MPSKPWWESWTVWFNLVGAVAVLAQYFMTVHLGDPKFLEGIMVVVNIILRFKTEQAITFK